MSYGCGASDCKACYPFQYRCEVCSVDFPEPIPNGQPLPTCTRCGYDGVEPDTIDRQAKDADGFCLECGEPHAGDSCPIWTNQQEVPQTLTTTTD